MGGAVFELDIALMSCCQQQYQIIVIVVIVVVVVVVVVVVHPPPPVPVPLPVPLPPPSRTYARAERGVVQVALPFSSSAASSWAHMPRGEEKLQKMARQSLLHELWQEQQRTHEVAVDWCAKFPAVFISQSASCVCRMLTRF